MSSPNTNISMKTSGDKGISIQNYGNGNINLTIHHHQSSEKEATPSDVDERTKGKRYK